MGVLTDPVADMLTRIRNAVAVRHDSVSMPASKMKLSIAKILKEEGFIRDYQLIKGQPHNTIRIHLAYLDNREPVFGGLKRVSKPGLRVYVGKGEIPRVYGGLGTAIITTPQGVMTSRDAWHRGIGGELLCYVW